MTLTLPEIARALDGKVVNGNVVAPGPNHSAKDKSLSVTPSDTSPDGFVVHSFAGDDPNVCKDYVRKRLGLSAFAPGGKRPKNLNMNGSSNYDAPPSKNGHTTSEYNYVSPDTGKICYKKIRVDYAGGEKTFYFQPKQRGGSEPLLYGGERVQNALDNGETPTVLIVEGEKKVDRCRELGFLAVSGDSGSNSKWSPAMGSMLARCNVILMPDSDAPGERYIQAAAKAIEDWRASSGSTNLSTKVLRLFHTPNQGEKGLDVCDWQGTPEEFREHLARAETYRSANERANKFKMENFEEIIFKAQEEWLIKRFLPKQGISAIYGRPGSYKSFVAAGLALTVSLGGRWAGRRVSQGTVVYIAAEGAAGFRKRKVGLERAHGNLPAKVPFHLISAAPNLGAENGDAGELVAAIEAAAISPGLIVIDTLAQTLNSADENGVGMVQFVANANAIATRFNCLVLIIHHSGLSDDKRMRGHSSLNGALDAVILCERREGELKAHLTLQKLKDEVSGVRLSVNLSRVVVGTDEDGNETSTLVVESIEDAAPVATADKSRGANPSQRLLLEVVRQVITDAGTTVRPWADGPEVRAAPEDIIRESYFERVAEDDAPDTDPAKAADKRRQRFNRARKAMVDAKLLIAAKIDNRTHLWLPVSDPDGRTGL